MSDLQVGPGTGKYLPFARDRLRTLTALRRDLNLPTLRKHYKIGPVVISIRSSEFGNFIRLTGGDPTYFFAELNNAVSFFGPGFRWYLPEGEHNTGQNVGYVLPDNDVAKVQSSAYATAKNLTNLFLDAGLTPVADWARGGATVTPLPSMNEIVYTSASPITSYEHRVRAAWVRGLPSDPVITSSSNPDSTPEDFVYSAGTPGGTGPPVFTVSYSDIIQVDYTQTFYEGFIDGVSQGLVTGSAVRDPISGDITYTNAIQFGGTTSPELQDSFGFVETNGTAVGGLGSEALNKSTDAWLAYLAIIAATEEDFHSFAPSSYEVASVGQFAGQRIGYGVLESGVVYQPLFVFNYDNNSAIDAWVRLASGEAASVNEQNIYYSGGTGIIGEYTLFNSGLAEARAFVTDVGKQYLLQTMVKLTDVTLGASKVIDVVLVTDFSGTVLEVESFAGEYGYEGNAPRTISASCLREAPDGSNLTLAVADKEVSFLPKTDPRVVRVGSDQMVLSGLSNMSLMMAYSARPTPSFNSLNVDVDGSYSFASVAIARRVTGPLTDVPFQVSQYYVRDGVIVEEVSSFTKSFASTAARDNYVNNANPWAGVARSEDIVLVISPEVNQAGTVYLNYNNPRFDVYDGTTRIHRFEGIWPTISGLLSPTLLPGTKLYLKKVSEFGYKFVVMSASRTLVFDLSTNPESPGFVLGEDGKMVYENLFVAGNITLNSNSSTHRVFNPPYGKFKF